MDKLAADNATLRDTIEEQQLTIDKLRKELEVCVRVCVCVAV